MDDSEFYKRVRQDKAYKTMRTFILNEFSKGEIVSLDNVLHRYFGKHPSSTLFENWDVAILFDLAISSLCQEGKMHVYASGERTEYILDRQEKTVQTQQRSQEER